MEGKVLAILFLAAATLEISNCQPAPDKTDLTRVQQRANLTKARLGPKLGADGGVAACVKKLKEDRAITLPKHQKKLELDSGTYFLSSEKETWPGASRKCRQAGLELVSVETEEESAEIIKALGAFRGQIWTSGTDFGSVGSFYWASTGANLEDHHGLGMALNRTGNQHCVHYRFCSFAKRYVWHEQGCLQPFVFLCQLK